MEIVVLLQVGTPRNVSGTPHVAACLTHCAPIETPTPIKKQPSSSRPIDREDDRSDHQYVKTKSVPNDNWLLDVPSLNGSAVLPAKPLNQS
jgi:hypothetical protein